MNVLATVQFSRFNPIIFYFVDDDDCFECLTTVHTPFGRSVCIYLLLPAILKHPLNFYEHDECTRIKYVNLNFKELN